MLAEAKEESERLLNEANEESTRLASEQEVVRRAERQAEGYSQGCRSAQPGDQVRS